MLVVTLSLGFLERLSSREAKWVLKESPFPEPLMPIVHETHRNTERWSR